MTNQKSLRTYLFSKAAVITLIAATFFALVSMVFILDVSASTLRTYSRSNSNAFLVRSNGQTTPHFRVHEVMCRCNNRNCPTNFQLCSRLVDVLHNLREEFGAITITGALRCPHHRYYGSGSTWHSINHNNGWALDIAPVSGRNATTLGRMYDSAIRHGAAGGTTRHYFTRHGSRNETYIMNDSRLAIHVAVRGGVAAPVMNPVSPARAYTVTASSLVVRNAPNGAQVGAALPNGAAVSVTAISRDVIGGHRWARIGTGRYVAYTHLRESITFTILNPPRAYTVNASSLVVRSSPNGTQVGTALPNGTAVLVTAITTNSIGGHRWARIGTGRYVAYTHLRAVGFNIINPTRSYRVTASSLVVRNAPNPNAAQVGTVNNNQTVQVSATTTIYVGGHRWARIGAGRYVAYTHLRRV